MFGLFASFPHSKRKEKKKIEQILWGGSMTRETAVVFLSSFFCFFPVYRDIAVDGTLLSTIEGVVKKIYI